MMAVGYRCNLVIISYLKRAVAMPGATVAETMELLEALNGFVDTILTAEAVAAVQPACNTAVAMIHESMKLPTKEWGVLGRADLFSEFVRLNPSLRTAIELCDPTRSATSERAVA